ncbi:unnamed protein product [Ambrosiozyma monospora]|uniref:Unnamed protein product n=1 Tax=Ambrosiozyma monospora TaxID=43982 RepID=A0ACB5SUE6_AMBMO|nr:unnamed protein product [Ambrosiozyma monospora]
MVFYITLTSSLITYSKKKVVFALDQFVSICISLGTKFVKGKFVGSIMKFFISERNQKIRNFIRSELLLEVVVEKVKSCDMVIRSVLIAVVDDPFVPNVYLRHVPFDPSVFLNIVMFHYSLDLQFNNI